MSNAYSAHDVLLTSQELAAQLKVRADTIRKWARDGLIPSIRIKPKTLRFNAAMVMAALTKKGGGRG